MRALVNLSAPKGQFATHFKHRWHFLFVLPRSIAPYGQLAPHRLQFSHLSVRLIFTINLLLSAGKKPANGVFLRLGIVTGEGLKILSIKLYGTSAGALYQHR